ncbi:4Fe-4S dicluster domain-containing protein [Candidatus Sumerlaeota bacterium]|nr:4Fe-4S dicluster domain-containing protein [Candidatus Sumerlaeota bacterium]
MQRWIVTRDNLSDLIRRWAAERLVLAPVKREAVEFEPVSAADEICFGYRNTRSPAKQFFFRPSEAMLRFDFTAAPEKQVVEMQPAARPTVLFGVRPCDARSLVLLDRVFMGEQYRDPYYAARREATLIVALACTGAAPTCFCTAVGGGLGDRTGADLFITDLGESLVLDAVTDRGETLLGKSSLPEADVETAARADHAVAQAAAQMPTIASLEEIAARGEAIFDDPCWETISERCLACAACSYLCPTCHCFDIQDETLGDKGRRIRNYDACMFPLFTLHASGHNPRTEKLQRVRQRLMHKFAYFPGNFGAVACVGCGRCIRACPAGNDIRQWLRIISDRIKGQTGFKVF